MKRAGIPAIAALVALTVACPRGEPGEGEVRRITILATNDFHGAFHEERRKDGTAVGGAVALAETLERLRKDAGAERTLLLDGGDLFQGTPLVNRTRGMASIELFGMLGYDAVAVGNHEFDYRGPDDDLRAPLKAAAAAASFPMLTANTFHDDGRPFTSQGIVPSVLLERGGVTVGILGLTTGTTPTTSHPKGVVGLTFEKVAVAADREAAALRARGAEVVIALAHVTGECGDNRGAGLTDPPRCTLTPSELSSLVKLPDGTLDVIVAGHQNQVIHHRYADTWVMEQAFNGRAVGRLDLVVGPEGVDHERTRIHPPIPVAGPPREPECDALGPSGDSVAGSDHPVARWLAKREADLQLGRCSKVGCLTAAATRDRATQAPAGTLVAAAMRDAWPADVAMQNGGGIRTNLPAGPVYAADLFRLLPFDNTLVRLELSGAMVRRVLQAGTSGEGAAVQVAGLDYGWDPNETGDRLCWVRIGGEPMDPQKTYSVVMNDYMVAGGVGIPGLERFQVGEGPKLRDALGDALRKAGDRCLDPTAPDPSQIAFRTACP